MAKRVCKCCALPPKVLEDTEARLRAGVSKAAIAQWLKQQALDITVPQLTYHHRQHLGRQAPMPVLDLSQDGLDPKASSWRLSEGLRAATIEQIKILTEAVALNPSRAGLQASLTSAMRLLHDQLRDVSFEGTDDD